MGNESKSQDAPVGELNLPLPVNHSPLPKFANLHLFFTKLASIYGSGSVERRRDAIAKFLDVWRTRVGDDFYPFVRLWFTEEDEQLKQLRRIKDTMVSKLLVEAMDLPAKSPDAIMLMDVRKGAYGAKRGNDDGISAKAKHAIEQRYAQTEFSSWRIDEVTEKLVKFIEARKPERVAILKEFLDTMNADEMFWVIKIIIGNVSLNCSVKTFLSVLHPDSIKVYLVNKNLRMVCHQLWSQNFQVSEVDKRVHLLSHFSPMRAKFVKDAAEHMEKVVELMKSQQNDQQHTSFFMEEKVDGERVQLHWIRESDTVGIYSRNGKDHTASYQSVFRGQSVEEAYAADSKAAGPGDDQTRSSQREEVSKSTRQEFSMKDIVADDVETCILDGEVVAWDPETNDICGQSKVRELTVHKKGGRYRHIILVFDVVLVNGIVLTDEPLRKRKIELEKVLPQGKRLASNGRIQILPYKYGHNSKDISAEFDRIVNQMSEGMVVKNPESPYEIDGRNNSWLKVKPEFVDGYQGENLDLVVVGCYWGTGKYKNQFASYLCALRDESKEKRYVAVSRVGSGICMAMYDYINEKINPVHFGLAKPPPWLMLGNEKTPDFYIDPSSSIIFEVKYSMISSVAAEKAKGKLGYGMGYSLRFPRYARLREDKDVKSALTIGEFLDLHMSSVVANPSVLRTSSARGSNTETSNLSKRTKIRDDALKENVTVQSNILTGLLFYLCGDISDPNIMTRSQLERFIRENGGNTTDKIRGGVIGISDSNVPNAAKLIAEHVSVIHPRYIFDCVENGRQIEYEPRHYFSGEPITRQGHETVDKFGFSLYRKQSKRDVQHLFYGISASGLNYPPSRLSAVLQQLLNANAEPHGLRAFLFAELSVYVNDAASTEVGIACNKLKYGSAKIVDDLVDATHILFSRHTPDLPEGYNDLKIISCEWVNMCWKGCEIVPIIKDEVG